MGEIGIRGFRVRGYRSVDDWQTVRQPSGVPLVLIGENNAGKSNLVRALELVLGDRWPKSWEPEAHEFFGRSSDGVGISIQVGLRGVVCDKCPTEQVNLLTLTHARDDDPPTEFEREAIQGSSCAHTWMSNAIREQVFCAVLGAKREADYQLSYRSKFTVLSKLMHRFHERLVADPSRVESLEEHFAGLVELFGDVSEFADFNASLKSASKDFGGGMRYGLDIDFSAYDASNFFRSLRVFPHLHGVPRSYDELGTGQEQVLVLAFMYAYARTFGATSGLVLVVEEPESHLHPLAQQWLARQLRALASEGVDVVITSHSPYMLDLARPEAIARVHKRGEGAPTIVTQPTLKQLSEHLVATGVPVEKADPAGIGPFYEAAATPEIAAGLLGRAVVLVEGPTEAFALPVLLHKVGFDCVAEGLTVVPVGGLTVLPRWLRFFTAYELPTYVVADTDRLGPPEQWVVEPLSPGHSDLVRALGIDADSYRSQVCIDGIGVGAAAAFVDRDYERAMRSLFGSAYTDAEAAMGHLHSKHLIAREVASRLPRNESTAPGWDVIEELAAALRLLAA